MTSNSASQDHPTTAQDARQRIRDAAIGDVVPLDTFPARAVWPVVTMVANGRARKGQSMFQERTFERTDAGWKRVK